MSNQALILDYSSLTSTLIISATCHSSSPLQDSRYDDFKRIGDLAFTQLAELRHRGAFSTVAQTFTACCLAAARENSQSGAEALNSSNESSLPTDLLEKWYRVSYPNFFENYTRKLPLKNS